MRWRESRTILIAALLVSCAGALYIKALLRRIRFREEHGSLQRRYFSRSERQLHSSVVDEEMQHMSEVMRNLKLKGDTDTTAYILKVCNDTDRFKSIS